LDNLTAYVKQNFPRLPASNISQILAAYASPSTSVDPSDPKFATDGTYPPTAVNVSQAGTGQQQRANVRVPDVRLLGPGSC